MQSALDVHRELLARDVPHEVVRLSTSIAGADDLPRALGLPAERCVAVRCYVVEQTRFVAVMTRAGDVPDPSSLLDALQARSLRPATGAEVNARTDYAAGLVCPVCLPDDVLLLSDSRLSSADVLYTATGEPGLALGIGIRDLLVTSGARAATLTASPLPTSDAFAGGAQVLRLPRARGRERSAG